MKNKFKTQSQLIIEGLLNSLNPNLITIYKSPTADTRTCNVLLVTKLQLLDSSKMHIQDVQKGIQWFINRLKEVSKNHDFTKLSEIDMFFKDFKNNFKTTDWWQLHKKEERHHISQEDGVRLDVDLFDVILFLIDGVMAGLARSGLYRKLDIPEGLLLKAFYNTVLKLIKDIKVLEK